MNQFETKNQKTAFESPWRPHEALLMRIWWLVELILFRPTPKFFNPWRLLLLRVFGAKISGSPFVFSSVRIHMPWNLELEDRACLGPSVIVYNLARLKLEKRVTVSQFSFLCGGSHDLSDQRLPLIVAPITLKEDVFLGARVFVLPGVTMGEGAVAGACTLVTKDVDPWTVVGGNPAKKIKDRILAK